MANHSDKIKNVLSNEMVLNLASNTEMLTKAINNGFKGTKDMNLEEITNTFVEMFGWDGYAKAISKINSDSNPVHNTTVHNTTKKYIAYSDASYISQTGEGYVGYVIKTTDNELVYRDAKKVDVRDIHVGESLALLTLLNKAIELGIKDIDVYGDNKGLIHLINSRRKLNGHMPNIVNKMNKFDSIKLQWNNRSDNRYADMLCRLKRRGANVTKQGGKFDLDELLKLSAKVGLKCS